MGAISQARMAVDSSSVLGPRPSWEDTRAPPHPPPPQAEYVAKLDRSFHRPRVGNSAARIALLSQLGAGASDLRSWGRSVPPTSVLWADIAELRGSRRLRQYIAERKREGEAPLELLTDLADGWEELRQRQRQRQQQPQPLQHATPPQICVAASGTAAAVTSAPSTTAAAAAVVAPATSSGSSPQRQQQSPPQPVVYVAESDWPAAAAAVAAVAAAAAGIPERPAIGGLLGTQSSSASSSNGSVTRVVDGPAKPAPSSVVLVHFPQKPVDGGVAVAEAAVSTAAAAAPPSTALLPPRPLRRASSLQMPSLTEVTTSILTSPVRRTPGHSGGTDASAAAAAVAAGFVPSLERYHTTYTLPSRALTIGADKLSPRTLVSATRLVEVVEVVQPPRMRSQLRLSDSSGGEDSNRVAATVGEPRTCTTPQLPVRRHSIADSASWAAGMRAYGSGDGGGVGEHSMLTETTAAVRVRELAAFPVAAWAAAVTNTAASAATCGADGADTISDVGASGASSPRLGPFEAATSARLQAQRWKRLAASPAAGTQIGPGAFAHMAAVAEEAAPARTLGLVPALATSASQIVVLASAPATSVAGSAPPMAKTALPTQPPPPGPLETKRMKSQTVAQLEKRWSLNGRSAVAAASTASSSLASSSSFRLPFLSHSSSFSGGSSSLISSASSLKDDLVQREVTDTVFLTQVYGAASASTGLMDVIREEPAEEEEDKPHGDLPMLLNTNRRQGSHLSDPGHDRLQGLLLPSPPVAAAPAGLPPRPPPGPLRNRSMSSITFTNFAAPSNAGAGSRTLNRQSIIVGPSRRVRAKEPPPAPPPAATAAAPAAVAAAADSGGGIAVGISSDPLEMRSASASDGIQLKQQSLRRLLSDQVRLASMVYGVGSGGTSAGGSCPEDQHPQPLEPQEILLPPPPPRQHQHPGELRLIAVTTEAHSVTEQPQQQNQQQQEQNQKQFAQPPPYSLASEPEPAEEPYVPHSFSRQPSPQSGECHHHNYVEGGLLRRSLDALSVLSDRTGISGSPISDGCGGGAGAFFVGSVTDHSTDLSYLPGDTRCTTSSFFTTTSSVAPSETALTSPAPSAEPSWTPAPGPVSRVSSADSSGTIASRNSNRTGPVTAAVAAATSTADLPPGIPQADAEAMTAGAAAALMSSMQMMEPKGGTYETKKSAAARAAVIPARLGGSTGGCHPAISHRGRPQEHFATKRSGGGYLIISTCNADGAASDVNANTNTIDASSGGAAIAGSVSRSLVAPSGVATCSNGGKAVATSIHVEADADAVDHEGVVETEEEGLKPQRVVTAGEAASEGGAAAAGVDNIACMVGVRLSVVGQASEDLPESHMVTMAY
ncbi:hypothetical protein Vretimale_7669 [Volvox reticuliferus]|nr:hypothetical protein Vretimale_7669 [Volvox reticuliferus]